MNVAVKRAAKRLIPLVNRGSERLGVRLQPVHYYSEVPDRTALRRTRSEWARPVALTGVHWDLDEQLDWLRGTAGTYVDEVAGLESFRGLGVESGPGYGPVESLVLHGAVRALAPARILEVGSGVSTVISRRAADRNVTEGRGDTAITCIEPYPRDALLALPGVTVHRCRAQQADAALFDALGDGDVLFIDSTHTVRTGSETIRLYLEVLPNLAPGVVVHVHDIMLPYLFAPEVLESPFDWQETTLLAALLTQNAHFRVLACTSALHHERQEALREILPDYRPLALDGGLYPPGTTPDAGRHFPSSMWLTKV